MTDKTLRTYVADHPRAMGVLFLLVFLAIQAQPVAAGVTFIFGP